MKHIGVIFGGRSAEHEISICSANGITNHIDRTKYHPLLLWIDREGKWFIIDDPHWENMERSSKKPVDNLCQLLSSLEVVFPILHGPFGEDGTLQGMLQLLRVPYVGSSLLGSALCMDKEMTKRCLAFAGIDTAKFIALRKGEEYDLQHIIDELRFPCFVKPANLGSSIGVYKCYRIEELVSSIESAFTYSHKILIEEMIDGDEIECSVLGESPPLASLPARIIPKDSFYSYRAKYNLQAGTRFEIPAKIDQSLIEEMRRISLHVFRVLECYGGMARVDCFITSDQRIIVNEVNTIPGFTLTSTYAKMWQATGISFGELIDRLILLACERSVSLAEKRPVSPRTPI